ncbi:hypothetical protein CRI85_05580 [Leuconostoc pseudomesenteroides]|uniref:hypothetical protein n=1 Tax=Leuconostoc pseudomesenteroides TaxID=33968 RepID=UPI001E4DF680|nr:hypothetical protein [Leuconostoc pseudomesenteroides]MCC8439804.1 hypothetical protein [Leuconostoc pseudomesenteroides]
MKTLEELQTELIQNIYNVMEDDADVYYLDGEFRGNNPKGGMTAIEYFFEKNGAIIQKTTDIAALNSEYDLVGGLKEANSLNHDVLDEIRTWFLENKQQLPNRLRFTYDTRSQSFNADFAYATPEMLEETDESWDLWNEFQSRDKWIEEIESKR